MRAEKKDRWTFRIDYGMSWRDCPFTIFYCNNVRRFSKIGGCKKLAHEKCIALENGLEQPPEDSSGF